MGRNPLRIGIAGCGQAARVHLERLVSLPGVCVVGCADVNLTAAQALATRAASGNPSDSPLAFNDHRELLKQLNPDAVAIFTPHQAHYRLAMDALQAGCHLFIEKPLSTNVQEAVDVVNLARARERKVGVGHQYRLRSSLVEARRRVREGAMGRVHLVTATLAQPWLPSHQGSENTWRFDPKVAGGGILADTGTHLIDALLWTTGQVALEVAAIQTRLDSGGDVVTAATLRLSDGTPATIALSGVSAGSLFELTYFGERGRLLAADQGLECQVGGEPASAVILSEPATSIDADFVSAVAENTPLCCPGDQALDTVRLLEAIARSAATGQLVRLA